MSSSTSKPRGCHGQTSVASIPSGVEFEAGGFGHGGFNGGTGFGDQGFDAGGITPLPTSAGHLITRGNSLVTQSPLTPVPAVASLAQQNGSTGVGTNDCLAACVVNTLAAEECSQIQSPGSVCLCSNGLKDLTICLSTTCSMGSIESAYLAVESICKNVPSSIVLSALSGGTVSSESSFSTSLPSPIRAHTPKTPLSAIIGGAAGGMVVLMTIIIVIYKYRHTHQSGSHPPRQSVKTTWYRSEEYTINSFDPTSPVSPLSMGSDHRQPLLSAPSILARGRHNSQPILTPMDQPGLLTTSKFAVPTPHPPWRKSEAARSTSAAVSLDNLQSTGLGNEGVPDNLDTSSDPPPRYSIHEYPR
ncbi:hypothetical protein BJ165DRAFT_1527764 [Panaeolus papilionaceus]|nr:hypothetical protein BJ165DRAFT_1527764 [Panaeolus papilionaceus]